MNEELVAIFMGFMKDTRLNVAFSSSRSVSVARIHFIFVFTLQLTPTFIKTYLMSFAHLFIEVVELIIDSRRHEDGNRLLIFTNRVSLLFYLIFFRRNITESIILQKVSDIKKENEGENVVSRTARKHRRKI